MNHILIAYILLILISCSSGIENAVETQEEVRVEAFMSGKVLNDGAFIAPKSINSPGDFQFDHSSSNISQIVLQHNYGIKFISKLHNEDLSHPEQNWKDIYIQALQIVKSIDSNKEMDLESRLINYEMVAFPMFRHFLNKLKPSSVMAEASKYFLELLLNNGTIGELDLLAENLKRTDSYLNKVSVDNFKELIKEQCWKIIQENKSSEIRLEKSKSALAIIE